MRCLFITTNQAVTLHTTLTNRIILLKFDEIFDGGIVDFDTLRSWIEMHHLQDEVKFLS